MKGLDTNILVRYLVKDDKRQAEKAAACIRKVTDSGEIFFINLVVFCELVWVLDSAYGYERMEIAGVLEKLLITQQFEIESRDIVRQAIHDYKTGGADFADYLIGRINIINNCDTTFTFDQSLKKSPLFSLLL